MNAQPPGREILSKPRARKEAAKVLGIAIQTRYRKLLEASGENEIIIATADLAQTMYENVEFTIWALKMVGGLNPPPPEELRKITPPKQAANDDPRFAKPPPFVLQQPVPDECTCEPLEPGIIGGDRHMTSCPKYVP
jgi:hypothetical protein